MDAPVVKPPRFLRLLTRRFFRRRRPFNGLFDKLPEPVSKNERAAHLVGLRFEDREGGALGVVPFDQPCELGYHCPVCEYPAEINGTLDERLFWSEYEGFLWCAICNKDYPSCLCLPNDPNKAISTYLSTVGAAIERFRNHLP
jgi:hypothetical protein